MRASAPSVKGMPCAGVETIAATGERYEGDFADDSRHGVGASRNDAGDTYQGEFRNGRRHGVGEARDAVSGVTYVGPHVDDLPVHLPVELEIEALGPPDEEGGPPVRLGSEDAPVRAKLQEIADSVPPAADGTISVEALNQGERIIC